MQEPLGALELSLLPLAVLSLQKVKSALDVFDLLCASNINAFFQEIGGWTAVVEKADELYNSDEFAELYEYLREHIEDSDCAENVGFSLIALHGCLTGIVR